MIKITDHAAKRFVERVMGINQDMLTAEMMPKVKQKILEELIPVSESIIKLSNGEFIIDRFVYVVKNHHVVTVKRHVQRNDTYGTNNEMCKRYKGGIMRSGKKVKKDRK